MHSLHLQRLVTWHIVMLCDKEEKEFMNPLVIAVDTGNKNIKTPHTEPFNSGLICHGAIPPAVKSDTLLFDGNYYTLTQSRIPYMYNKTTDWSYYVLTLIAIAKEMMAMGYVRPGQKQVKQDVCLAMGLPPTHIHDLASEYDKYFGRDGRRVVFTYNNVDFEVRIVRVMVFPQGVAAIAPYMSKSWRDLKLILISSISAVIPPML